MALPSLSTISRFYWCLTNSPESSCALEFIINSKRHPKPSLLAVNVSLFYRRTAHSPKLTMILNTMQSWW